IQGLRRWGWQFDVLDLGDSFPFPTAAQRAMALLILSVAPGSCPIVLDGLAFGALPEAGALRSRRPLIALAHQPLDRDAGLAAAPAAIFRESERAALAPAACLVVPMQATGRPPPPPSTVQSHRPT